MDYGSPAENQNKGYAKQEKKDLLNDNPIAKDASGGRPMILKHMSGSKGSPLMKHHGAPMKMDEMYNGIPGVQKDDFDQFKK